MKEMYYVISPDEGDFRITALCKDDLIEYLEKEYWGSNKSFVGENFNSDINCWNHSDILIIKGKVVIPKPVQIVKTYGIE